MLRTSATCHQIAQIENKHAPLPPFIFTLHIFLLFNLRTIQLHAGKQDGNNRVSPTPKIYSFPLKK